METIRIKSVAVNEPGALSITFMRPVADFSAIVGNIPAAR